MTAERSSLAHLFLPDISIAELRDRIVELAARTIPGCSGATITTDGDDEVKGILAVPLLVGEHALGVLTFHSESADAFVDSEAAARAFADEAAVVLANAQAYWQATDLCAHLQTALESRAAIDQAKGILMAQSGVDSDEAFQLLVRASQRANRKLREVAIEIVEKAVKPKS